MTQPETIMIDGVEYVRVEWELLIRCLTRLKESTIKAHREGAALATGHKVIHINATMLPRAG